MDSLNGLIFPRTIAQYAHFRQLLIFFDTLTLYQPAEDCEADSSGLAAAGMLKQSVPAPFGEELETFGHLVHSMVGQAGDGVLLRILGAAMHVGVVVAPKWMLHIEHGTNAMLEKYTGPHWSKRVIGFYRHEKLFTD